MFRKRVAFLVWGFKKVEILLCFKVFKKALSACRAWKRMQGVDMVVWRNYVPILLLCVLGIFFGLPLNAKKSGVFIGVVLSIYMVQRLLNSV
ncbi:hypothetical protein HHE03_17240 [Helicobacter heilmannii]|nr:hypothetical protein HHE014_07570 [Helicobacter heilmannii]CRF50029.1 hypothetical protein HHE03_17240 [Helicobacter heilmannii]